MKRFIDGFCKFNQSLWFEPILLALCVILLCIPAESTELQVWSLFVGFGFGINIANWSLKIEDKIKQNKNRQTKTQ